MFSNFVRYIRNLRKLEFGHMLNTSVKTILRNHWLMLSGSAAECDHNTKSHLLIVK